jgi:hypothetical protein
MTMAGSGQSEKCCATTHSQIRNCRHIQRLQNRAVEDGSDNQQCGGPGDPPALKLRRTGPRGEAK